MLRNHGGRPRGRRSRSLRAGPLVDSLLAVLVVVFNAFVTAVSRRGFPRALSRLVLAGSREGGAGRTTVGFVAPSEARLAPKSTGFTRVTLWRPQRSPSCAMSICSKSIDFPAEATGSPAALSNTIEMSWLDLTNSLA